MHESAVPARQPTAAGKTSAHPVGVSPSPSPLDPNRATPDGAIPPPSGAPTSYFGWDIFRNTAAQVVGRNFIALGRLVVAGMIVRGFGKGTFGEYSLIFALLSIAEWVLDFGTTEAFVREICREPAQRQRLLRILTVAKIVQIPAAFGVFVAILLALRYPPQIMEAGLVGGAGLVFFGGVLVYRVIFRSNLTMEREVGAELMSVLVMVPLIAMVTSQGGGLTELFACYLISRAVFFGLCFFLGKNHYRPSLQGVTWQDVRWSWRWSSDIGVIGFLVVVNETLDILVLSRLSTFSDLAYYSGAQRFTMPLLTALASIGATLYPVAASYWPRARSQFEQACQLGFDTVMVVAGLAICSMLAGAEFFMGLLGPALVVGAPVLRVLAVLCFVKALSSILGPVLYVVQAQRQVLQLVVVVIVVKASVLAALAPQFGYMGVAFGALVVELLVTAVPLLYLVQRFTGYRVRWSVPIKVAMITVLAAGAPRLLFSATGFPAAVMAPALYLPLAFLSGAARFSDVRRLLKKKRS